jgi:cellulose synthase/poly-beta-1,6-N-acetylglucosamine synthase-like glycosyltransferase
MSLLPTAFLVLYTALLLVLFLYAAHAYYMIFLFRKSRHRRWQAPPLRTLPPVTIQLPIYNEQYVVKRLIDSVCAIDYPRNLLEIQVLDDSTDETVGLCAELVSAYRAQGIDIRHVRRSNRQGYKAGALRDGLAQARGEFVAIFDADFTPESDFLRNTLPHFADPRVGVVQTRWGHLNDGYSFLTRGQALGLDGHFVIEQAARNRNNLFINFNGTGGVWRKTAILDSGNWQDDTLTEDMDLSYRAQLRGWRFVYLDNVVCKGEIPAEVNAFKVQQHRWAKGAVQTAKKILPQVWRRPDLRFMVKIQATIHLTNHLVFPVLVAVALSTFPLLILKATASRFHGFFVFASLFTLGAFSYPALYL